jgi:hypothetical protein
MLSLLQRNHPAHPNAPPFYAQLDVKDGVALTTVTVPNAKLWSLGSPNLHTLSVTLNGGDDAITVRFGLVCASPFGTLTSPSNQEYYDAPYSFILSHPASAFLAPKMAG